MANQFPSDAVNCADCGEPGLKPSLSGEPVYCLTCGAKRFMPGYREATEPQKFEQEWKGPRLGDKYAFAATCATIVVGYPRRISIKALMGTYKVCDNPALMMHRVGKSKAFYVEGPVPYVEYLVNAAQVCRREYEGKEIERMAAKERKRRGKSKA